MIKFLVILLISLSLYECVALKMTPKHVCEKVSGGNKIIRLTITKDIDVKHAVLECDGKRAVYIEGAANASTFAPVKEVVTKKPSTFPPVEEVVTQKPSTFPPVEEDVTQKPSTFPPVEEVVTLKPSTFPPVEEVVTQKPSTFPLVEEVVTQKSSTFPPVEEVVTQKPSTFPPVEEVVTQKSSTFPPVEEVVTQIPSTFPPVEEVVTQKPSTFPPVEEVVTQKPSTFPPVEEVVTQKPSTFPPVEEVVTLKPSTFSPVEEVVTQKPPTVPTANDPLRFHSRWANNIVILKDGQVAQRDNEVESLNSHAFTNRPLRDNEVFTVLLESCSMESSIGIGVVTESPDTIQILDHMRNSSKAFMLYHRDVYTNGKKILRDYGRDLYNLKEGGTAGVKRTANGTLHFYINGVDQGEAVTGIPSPVYGIVDLWRAAYRVSIVQLNS